MLAAPTEGAVYEPNILAVAFYICNSSHFLV